MGVACVVRATPNLNNRMKRFHVLLPDDDFQWLYEASEVHGKPVSEIVRSAVSQYRAVAERDNYPAGTAMPSKDEDDDKGIRERLVKLEAFVFEVLTSSLGVINPAVMRIPDYAPDYLIGRPKSDL